MYRSETGFFEDWDRVAWLRKQSREGQAVKVIMEDKTYCKKVDRIYTIN